MPLPIDGVFFRDPDRARPEILNLTRFSDATFHQLETLIRESPDPDQAVHYLDLLQSQDSGMFDRILTGSTALRFALAVYGHSTFLAEAIVRNPDLLLRVSAAADLDRVLRKDEYEERLRDDLLRNDLLRDDRANPAISAYQLASFRRFEILRIFLRDVLGFGSLSDITEEISNLADAILNVSLLTIRADASDGEFSVLALGKLGGQELNYSSDIDLMFVYSGEKEKERFQAIARQLTELLSTYTNDGLCYRIDLRLRPDGRYGEICHSIEGAKHYYSNRARDWELQMLIKARVAAGDTGPGRELLAFVEPLIYSTTLDFEAVESVSEARQRIHEKLKRSRQSGINVKLASGGIRDIEFLVQCLQRLHGGREPWLRHGGTILALARLRDKNYLSGREYSRLFSAYEFLRHLEHRLQLQDDRQTHTLPTDPDQLETLARKMPKSLFHSATAESLERELEGHLTTVREIYDRVIHFQRRESVPHPPVLPARLEANAKPGFPSANLTRFLEQRAPRFMARLAEARLDRGRERFEHFLEKIANESGHLDMLEIDSDLTCATLDLFEYSPYFGDQLLRHPGLLLEIAEACGERQGRVGFNAPANINGLRRYYREQMVRIQSDSVHRGVNVFKTLRRTSDLADEVIAAAYRIALAEIPHTSAPALGDNAPHQQMMVIALGRLGMKEFDVASDADLIFAIPDAHAGAIAFWTGVAERLIHVLSAYTGDGVIFTVDTRLRPHGREGDLVQTVSVFKDYFAHHAEAWEGIAYMKARAVAGNIEQGTAFLHELQQVDWRRYGQSGRSRLQLAEMRAKIEKELGTRNPLKAAPGGYYDIDFALLYLRLKGAGMFFRALNTPERIDVVEKMGHLDREDAALLLEAATLYRAIDHGMRITTGHPDGTLPTAPAARALLGELSARWLPERMRNLPTDILFHDTLAQVRMRTRALFERLFS